MTCNRIHIWKEEEDEAEESERVVRIQLEEFAQANVNFWPGMSGMPMEKAKETDEEKEEEEVAREGMVCPPEEGARNRPLPLLSQRVQDMVPNYIEVYWDKVGSQYPITHRPTFENPTDVPEDQLEVLKSAMAAVATQFLEHKTHRFNGHLLYLYAKEKARRVS